ncbi:MAG TPA: hypothetical protein VFQ61_05405, partial [Polyangiaceae bacterium]|nr:hypothetical protein [Polyangiaceae bacterium]
MKCSLVALLLLASCFSPRLSPPASDRAPRKYERTDSTSKVLEVESYVWTSTDAATCETPRAPPSAARFAALPAESSASSASPASGVDTTNSATPGSIADAAKTVEGMRPGFNACYKDFLRRSGRHGHSGAIRLRLDVNCVGAVSRLRADAYGLDRRA